MTDFWNGFGVKSWGCSRHQVQRIWGGTLEGSKTAPAHIDTTGWGQRNTIQQISGLVPCFVLLFLFLMYLKKRKRLGISERWCRLGNLKAYIVLTEFWKKKKLSDKSNGSLGQTDEWQEKQSMNHLEDSFQQLLQKPKFIRKSQLNNKVATASTNEIKVVKKHDSWGWNF